MGFRAADHPRRTEMFNAKCAKCGEQTRVPWDPIKEPEREVMCRNCRLIYQPPDNRDRDPYAGGPGYRR